MSSAPLQATAAPDAAASLRFVSILPAAILNHTGVADDQRKADLDRRGNAYLGSGFPAMNTTTTVQGVPFHLQRNAGGTDHFTPDGVRVPLPPESARLYLLGARTGGNDPGMVRVETADGSTTDLPVLLTDWCQSPRYGEVEVLSASERLTPSGVETQPNHLWAVSLELPSGARAVVFPKDESLHIFALTADLGAAPLWTIPPPVTGFATDRIPALAAPLPDAAPVLGGRHLGFVVHAGQKGQDAYQASGSHSMLLNLFTWGMRDQAKQLVDFAVAEKWLDYLYRTGVQAAVIIDTSIHHTNAPWRSQETSRRGENVRDQKGEQTAFSSPHSPRYQEMIRQYVEDLTTWISTHDKEKRIRAYVNGAEVFWPGILDSSPLAQAEFQKWLVEQYGGLEAINERWGASFKSLEEIQTPPFWRHGNATFGPDSFVYGDYEEGSWSTDLGPASPGMRYRVSAEILGEKIPNDFAGLQVVFTAPGRDQAVVVTASAGDTDGQWRRLEGTTVAPEWAERVGLYLTLKGSGRTLWRNPLVARDLVEENLVSNPEFNITPGSDGTTAPAEWNFSSRRNVVQGSLGDADSSGGKTLVLHGPETQFPYRYPSAAWYDFATFSMESYARIMNRWARLIKSMDPTREVMHYVGFLLGTLSEWDFLMLTQRPDIFLSQAPDADVNGLQLCAGNGDFHYATIVLDLARKYGKPLVATDLQDFTHGVYVGFNSLNRTSLACVAHGMTGVYYYNWFGTPDYSWFNSWASEDTKRMVDNVSKAVSFLDGAKPETRALFLLPILPYSEADPGGQKADMLDSMGWYKLVVQSGLFPDVYTPYELARREALDPAVHTVVVVPDCPFLTVAAANRLWEYVETGGRLVMGGRPPQFDETGRLLARPFLPDGSTPAPGQTVQRIVSDTTASEELRRIASLPANIRLSGAATLISKHDGQWSGVLRKPEGKGTITWTGGMDGRGYLGPVRRYNVAGNTPPLFLPDGDWTWPRPEGAPLLSMVRALTAEAQPEGVRLATPDPHLEVCVYRDGDERRIMLIHTGEGMHKGGSLVFSSAGTGKPEPEVWADFDPRPVDSRVAGEGEITLRLPDFADCCTIRF